MYFEVKGTQSDRSLSPDWVPVRLVPSHPVGDWNWCIPSNHSIMATTLHRTQPYIQRESVKREGYMTRGNSQWER